MRREKEYLKECLEKAGIKNEAITTWKRLQLKTDSHVGAALREGQTITWDSPKRNYEDQNGVRCVWTKVYAVDTRFKVVIGEHSEEACETIFLAFLEALGQGTRLDGNYMDIELGEVERAGKEDSILKVNIACQILVTFYGGIYRDDKKKAASVGGIRPTQERERKGAMARKEKGTGVETAAGPAVPVHETIKHWYSVHGTGPTVYAGTLYLKDWRPGKQVTEQEYLEAVIVFKEGPMAGTRGTR